MADTIFSTQFAEGAKKGKEIVAPGSLGRIGSDAAIQAAIAQQKELTSGMSSQEMQARREMAGQEINRAGQTEMRALQAQLARAGVKGGVAGAQLRDIAMGTIQQKANVEKQLMVEDRAARENSLQNYLGTLKGVTEFDLGQQAAEKNVELQTGLAFSGMGSAERASALMAGAYKDAASAQRDALNGGGGGPLGTSGVARAGLAVATGGISEVFCFTGDAEIEMPDGEYKKISELELGEETATGKVTAIGKAYAFAPIYFYRGDYCTGTHVVEEGGKWIRVQDSQEAIKTLLDDRTIVYPMDVESGFYYTKNGVKSLSYGIVEGTKESDEALRRINAQRKAANYSISE